MDNLLTLSVLPYTLILITFSLLAYYQNKKKAFSKAEIVYAVILCIAFSSASLMFKQQFAAGTGTFLRQGWPIAILEGGNIDFIGLFTSLAFYLLLTINIVSLYNKKRLAK